MSLSFQGKQWIVFVASDKIQIFNQILTRILEILQLLDRFPILKAFLMKWEVILTKMTFLILHYEMSHLEDLLNSMNQLFPKQQMQGLLKSGTEKMFTQRR